MTVAGKSRCVGVCWGRYPSRPSRWGGAVDLAREGREKAEERAQQRRFAAAVLADDAEVVPRADGEGQVLQERFVLVAERDVLAREDDGRFIHSLSPFLSAS